MREARREDAITIPVGVVRRLLTLLVILALAAAVFVVVQNRDRLFAPRDAAYVDPATYQAVFLIGGQAYFGKLEVQNEVYVLRDVFYLNAPADASQSLGQLLKRGGELHGPTEPMVIPARSVLFFENIRSDSQVARAIAQIKSGNTTTPPPAQATPARTPAPSPTPTR